MIVFDDADRSPLMFEGAGSRSAALKTWEKISVSWNAHLFVRIERNSRDDRNPSASVQSADHIEPVRAMVVPDIDETVSRFLSWPLPADVCSDPCATMPGYPHRYGTNLLTSAQAKAMLSYVLAAAPAPGDSQ